MSASIELPTESYHPFEVVNGTVEWVLEKAPAEAELRLVWGTDGRGSEEQWTVNSVVLANPKPRDRRAFRLDLAEMPYSFSGKVLQIYWRIELVVKYQWWPLSVKPLASRTIAMSPTGHALDPYGA